LGQLVDIRRGPLFGDGDQQGILKVACPGFEGSRVAFQGQAGPYAFSVTGGKEFRRLAIKLDYELAEDRA
jgi:hypothetical protein